MSLLDQRRWSVEVYQVLDHGRQQRVLESFRDIAKPDVTALGTQSGREWFVVVETSSPRDRLLARSIISTIDVHATRAYSFKASGVLGKMPAS